MEINNNNIVSDASLECIRREVYNAVYWKSSKMMGHVSKRQQFTVGSDYKFGNTNFTGISWESVPYLDQLRRRLGKVLCDGNELAFGMVHLNKYPDQDHVQNQAKLPWHADDEKMIDQTVPIVGLSFGEPMRLLTKPNGKGRQPIEELITFDGQMYMFKPGMQSTHQHCVKPLTKAQRKRIAIPTEDNPFFGDRYSITFRGLVTVH